MKTIIRQARARDAEAISGLLAQLGYPDIDESLAKEKIKQHDSPGYRLLVAEVQEKVVGFIALHWFELMHWKGRIGRMSSFCVDEDFRSKGIGQQLLEASEQFMVSMGCVKFEVTSNMKRTRTHGFYLRNGYIEDSRRFVKYPPH